MSLVISHYSALEILRSANSPVIPEHYSSASLSSRLPSHAERKELWIEVAHTYECKLRPPISILMSSSSPTYHPKGIYIHRSRESFNSKCFLHLFKDIYCTSPLYLPFQMSSILSEIELTLLICELLGTYSYRSTGVLLSKKEPLITKEQLREFLETMKGKRCYRKVHNAFLYACEMSASPMESKLYLRFTYPCRKGGYNLKNIILNPEIYLKQLDATNNKVRVRKPDLLVSNPLLHNDSQHPVKAVAIEYNGDYHDSLEQQHLDCIRYNELLSHGIKDYAIDRFTFKSVDLFDNLYEAIRKDLQLPCSHLTKSDKQKYRTRRLNLVKSLIACDCLFMPRELHPTARSNELYST